MTTPGDRRYGPAAQLTLLVGIVGSMAFAWLPGWPAWAGFAVCSLTTSLLLAAAMAYTDLCVATPAEAGPPPPVPQPPRNPAGACPVCGDDSLTLVHTGDVYLGIGIGVYGLCCHCWAFGPSVVVFDGEDWPTRMATATRAWEAQLAATAPPEEGKSR